VPFHSKARLQFGIEQIDCETVDVSLDGILVKCPRTIPAGSVVQVSMDLTQRMNPVVGAGSVVRILSGNRMGIHLNRLPLEESARLQEFLLPMMARD
jgi:hypothetical protein